MEYLNTVQFADIKGCTVQYARRFFKENPETVTQINPTNNRPQSLLPISALPEELKAKYYRTIRKEENAPPELKKPPAETPLKRHKNTVKRSFEEYSEAERNEISRWVKILEEWQALRSRYEKKTEFDPLYCAKIKLEQDVTVSPDILYKKYAAYRDQNLDGLLDGRGGWNKGSFNISEKVWKAFLWFYLDERQPCISECYRNVCGWTAEFYPELLNSMPTERSFRRHVKSDIDLYVKIYKREGEKALLDRCTPYVERLYDNIHANTAWIADNHTLDIISFDGKTNHRLYITAFQDAKSGVIVGFNVTENPSSQSTIIALRMAIMRFGIPDNIYLDNGSEFAKQFEYPVMFDLEDKTLLDLPKSVLTDNVIAFCDGLEKAGYYAALYSNPDWLTQHLDYEKLKRFDLWFADWRKNPSKAFPHGIWQYSETGRVNGISGNVDLDIAYNDYYAIIKNAGLNGFSKKADTYKATAEIGWIPSAKAGTIKSACEQMGMSVVQTKE